MDTDPIEEMKRRMAERPKGGGTGSDAIDVIGELDQSIRTIIGELAEGAARASMDWTRR